MRSTSLLSILSLILLAVFSTAWQFNGLQMAHGELLPRAESESSTTTAEPGSTPTGDTTSQTSSPTTDDSSSSTETTDSATTTGTKSSDHSTKGSSNSTTTTSISVDPRLPAGGISMIKPAATSTTYFKIGDPVTFSWNYTSLSITPSAVNVIASCSLNSATYTISSNMTVRQTQEVVWDTGAYQANATIPLLTATYTLIVYDESKEIDDIAGAGELSSQTRYYFGMYSPLPYQNLSEFQCATCNSAISATEVNAIKFALGMATITILSFTWFVGGLGIFST